MSQVTGLNTIRPQSFVRYNKPEARALTVVALDPEHGDFGPFTPNTQASGIQEAINYVASQGGGTVLIRSGVYQGMPGIITVPSNITLLGGGNTVIRSSPQAIYTLQLAGQQIKIKNILFDANGATATNTSPILILTGSRRVVIDNCGFINQSNVWYIQSQATFSSSSGPTGYIEDLVIKNCDINAATPLSVANESILIANAKRVSIRDNYFYVLPGQTPSSAAATIYDFSYNTKIYGNVFHYESVNGAHAALILADSTYTHIHDNMFYATPTYAMPTFLIQSAAQHTFIENNVVVGPQANYGANTATWSYFVQIGLQTAPGQGPDGNVSANNGYVDYLILRGNYVFGVQQLVSPSAYSGQWVPNYFEVSGNTYSTLRGPFTYAFPNGAGTIVWQDNKDIGDLIVGAGNIGNFGSTLLTNTNGFAAEGTSTAPIQTVIIRNNRMASYQVSGATSGAIYVQYANQVIVTDNWIGAGAGAGGADKYVNLANVSYPVVLRNTNYNLEATLSATPPASGVTQQNITENSITLLIPVALTPTASAAASASIAVGSSPSTLSTVQTISAAAGASPTGGVLQATVPAGQYWQVTLTNATAGQPIILP